MDRAARQEHAKAAHHAVSASPSGSIFEEGRNCCRVVRVPRAAMLVDAADYFRTFRQAAERATRSIIILGWDFDTRTRLYCDDVPPPGVPDTLGEFLNYLVKRNRKLHVHILNWDYPLVFGTDREFPPLYGWRWRPHRRVHLKYDNTHPTGGSHHQKIVVIDDAVGFSGGLDLTSRRWDTCAHRAEEPRRVSGDVPYPPFHDVMATVDGEAARVLGGIARARWFAATGQKLKRPAARGDPWPPKLEPELTDVVVGISRTMPETEDDSGVREVEALFVDMIARAKRYLYIENQYFTSHRIADALAARLAEPDGPEIVLVVRLLSHGWLEEHTMEVLRTQNIRKLIAADRHHRFKVYFPHVPALKEGTCVDIHSKVLVIDDEWLRIGSANICNRSMGLDTECDLAFEAQGNALHGEVIRAFRNRLLGEHLGVDPKDVQSAIERAGSINAAIATLQKEDGRTLKVLDQLPDWSEAVIEAASIADPEELVELHRLVQEFSSDMTTDRSRPAWGKLAVFALIVAALTAAWHYTPLKELITPDRISLWADEFSAIRWAPLVVLAAYTPACFVMFPRPLITLFAVLAFGPWMGFTYAMSGILAAAAATYYAGRLMDRRTVRRIAGAKVTRLSEVLRENGLLAVTALRLVPLAPFFVEGLVAGAMGIRLWHFMLGTFIGMLPGALAATIFGDQLEAALHDPSRINYGVVAGVALVFVVGTLAVRRWLRSQIRGAHVEKHGETRRQPLNEIART